MNLDFCMKMQLIETLAKAGYNLNIVTMCLNRIEVFQEDVSVALLNAIISLQPKKEQSQETQKCEENIENKENIS